MKRLFIMLLPFSFAFSADHVFWYNAATNGYDLQDSANGKGPGLPADVIIHEGMVVSTSVNQSNGVTSTRRIQVGSGLSDQGYCGVVWSRDLCDMGGSVTSALMRVEYCDGGAMCNAGPIDIICGVVDFQGNIDGWDGIDNIPEMAWWVDDANPLCDSMGFNASDPVIKALDTIHFTAPAGRPSGLPSVLDGKFAELNVADQVNWILAHTGPHKGSYSGQYAIVFLVKRGKGNTGMFSGYASEECIIPGGSDRPWTFDGNTMHLFMSGILSPVDYAPPVVSNVHVSNITGSQATITWITNEDAQCRVIYGIGGSYNLSSSQTVLERSFSVDLSGLSIGTQYNYKIIAIDTWSNIDTTGAATFITRHPPLFVSTPATMDTLARAGVAYADTVVATDVDAGDTITYSFLRSVNGMVLDSLKGALAWTPTDSQAGRCSVSVRAIDKYGLMDTLTFAILVRSRDTTAAEGLANENLPKAFLLGCGIPNPANPATLVEFAVPASGIPATAGARRVTIAVYDTRGGLVRTLVNGIVAPGYHSVLFDGGSLGSGIYFFRMEADGFVKTRTFVLMK